MILVMVTAQSYDELMKVAGKVTPILKETGDDFDGVCYVRADSLPLIVTDTHMAPMSKTLIFVMGITKSGNQSEVGKLEKRITDVTGFKTSVV